MKSIFIIILVCILIIYANNVTAMDISFEWSKYKEGECSDCIFFDLYKNNEIIIPDIPITVLTATVTNQDIVECTDYLLTARTENQRSGKSTVVRICPDEGPQISEVKLVL